MGRPTITLELSDDERRTLKAWVRARKTPAAEKQRAQIILGCTQGESGADIGARLGVSEQTISKWRRRFASYWRFRFMRSQHSGSMGSHDSGA